MKAKIILTIGALALAIGTYTTGSFSNLTTSLTNIKQANMSNPQLIINTTYGDIIVKIYDEKTPKAAENFRTLSKEGKYNDTIFHRVIKDFMIQGGDYENHNGTGGSSIWNTEFNDEFSDGLSNIRGALAMANHGPNTNGSQFFIVQRNSPHLDSGYTVFGHVTQGMEIVDKIATTKTDYMDKPTQDIKIISITPQK